MTTDAIPQGDLRLLEHPFAQELLTSAIPARVGYNAVDGSPRVTPMWFAWSGDELVFGAAGTAPKVKALQANPRVAVTIDTNPYKVLLIRGNAEVAIVEGAVEEYADAALRYMGSAQGTRFRGLCQRNHDRHGPHHREARLGRLHRLPNPLPRELRLNAESARCPDSPSTILD